MAKGPDVVLKNVEKEINDIEAIIDTAIDSEKYSFHESYITVPIPACPYGQVRMALIDKYTKAGWSQIIFSNDQRDGAWVKLYFKPDTDKPEEARLGMLI